jgi:hypothetical protein
MTFSQPARRIVLAALLLLFLGRVALAWRVFNDTVDEWWLARSANLLFGLSFRKLHWTSPDPGWIAISVNHLVGIDNDPGPARWLWRLEPRAKIGRSIWLFYLVK